MFSPSPRGLCRFKPSPWIPWPCRVAAFSETRPWWILCSRPSQKDDLFDARGAARCSRCRWEATTTTTNNNNNKAMAMTMTIIIFGCLIFLHLGCLITRGQLGSRTRICQNHQKSPQSWLLISLGLGASRGQCSQERSSTTEVCHHFTVCSRGAAIITHLRKL